MTKKSVLLIFGLFSTFTQACYENNPDASTSAESVERGLEVPCSPSMNGALYPVEKAKAPLSLAIEKYDDSDYWSDWVLKTESNPVLTQNFADNYFGVGWWTPKDMNSQDDELTTEEWLMNHGLMFSVGFGDKAAGQPRLRLDYLWHDEDPDNVMLQIEVPF